MKSRLPIHRNFVATLALLIGLGLVSAVTGLSGRAAASSTACSSGFADIYPCEQVDLLAHLSLADLSDAGSANDLWGWTDLATEKEYAPDSTSPNQGRKDGN